VVGANHRVLLPASVLFGGAFLVLCDTAARLVLFPAELPVGVITAFLGAPFFLWLLVRQAGPR
jgi:iron complex transport system permease protein